MRRRADRILVFALLALVGLASGFAAGEPAEVTAETAPAGPRLIVLVVIDQFRADYLDRFADRFGTGGFRRLEREGARFVNCAYPYAITETSPGHATIATGATPDHHGIVSNEWYDRAQGRMVGSIDDPKAPYVGAGETGEGGSPRNLRAATFADGLKAATGDRAKVFGVALKARAAILGSAHEASSAFWFDTQTGHFVSSQYYGPSLPAWVAAWNDKQPADRFRDRVHGKNYYEALESTPYSDELVLDLGRQIIEREGLGEDDAADFLMLGLSAPDYLGHDKGPYADEVAAMAAATDAQLAELLTYLDARLGRGRYWLALSADHGVSPTLEQARARGWQAVGVGKKEIKETVRKALTKQYGEGWKLRGETTRLWFDPAELKQHGAKLEEAARIVGEAASRMPGIKGYVAVGSTNLDPATVEAYKKSTFSGRSPDVFLLLDQYAVLRDSSAASHGTPWPYDTEVPLFLYGPPFRPGVYRDRCTPADLAPTLAAALGVPVPAQATGRVLKEALNASANADARPAPAR